MEEKIQDLISWKVLVHSLDDDEYLGDFASIEKIVVDESIWKP